MKDQFNPSLIEETLAALGIGANILVSPLSRNWYATWGATSEEQHRSLPGDEIVSSPVLQTTRAITIDAPPEAVWPWLVQMGQGRGGLYSYEKLENLAGCKMENLAEIRPELQNLAIGDKIRFGPEGYPFQVVVVIDPIQNLILSSPPTEMSMRSTWLFHLEQLPPQRTRLITRNRITYDRKPANTIIWRVFTDPIYFAMERRMLIGIKDRAEDQFHSLQYSSAT
jgi:hypothetical protein